MIVRELIALVLTKMDESSVKQIESRMFRLRTQIGDTLSRLFSDQLFKIGEDAARLQDARAIMESTGMSLAKLRKETRGLYSDMALVINYNKAEQFGIGDRFTDLAKIADAAGKKFGVAQEKALDDLIVGITQGRNARLDNIGIIVDWQKRFDAAAKQLGKSRKDLTKAETTRIGMEAAMKLGEEMVTQSTRAGANASDIYDQMPNLISNLRTAFGDLINVFSGSSISTAERFLTFLTEVLKKQSVIDFIYQLGVVFSIALRVIAAITGTIVNFVAILTKIPYLVYMLGAILLAVAIPAFGAFIAALSASTAALLTSAAATVVARLSAYRFALTIPLMRSAIFSVVRATAASIAMNIAWAAGFIALAAVIAFLAEEILALLSPEKTGIFEVYSEGFTNLREDMVAWAQKQNSVLAWLATGTVWIFSWLYDILRFGIVEPLMDLFNGLLYLIMQVITVGGLLGDNIFKDTHAGMWLGKRGNQTVDLANRLVYGERLKTPVAPNVGMSMAKTAGAGGSVVGPSIVTNVNVDASGQSLNEEKVARIAANEFEQATNQTLINAQNYFTPPVSAR